MKHVEFLNNLSDEEMLQIIEDIRVLTEETGEIPNPSLIWDITKLCSEDFNISYNLTNGLNAIHKEIMKRYKKLLTKE